MSDIAPGVTGISKFHIATLFKLYDAHGEPVFAIEADGKVTINPKLTASMAVDEFWKWFSTQTNLVQIAVEQAKSEERAAIVKQIEDQGKQWGIMRSMKMTDYSNAASSLADLIRK